jgi:hypothetical protein
MKRFRWLLPFRLLALLSLLGAAAPAPTRYDLQALVKADGPIGGITLGQGSLTVVGMNSAGEVVFFATDSAGRRVLFDAAGGTVVPILREGDRIGDITVPSLDVAHRMLGPTASGQTLILASDAHAASYLLQYASGRMSLIAEPGAESPGGHWSASLPVAQPVSMNALGVVLFAAPWTADGVHDAWGVFRWDPQTRQVTPAVLPGRNAASHLTVVSLLPAPAPVINNAGEIVFGASVQDAAGKLSQGLFFMDSQGDLQPVALFGSVLPDGRTCMGFPAPPASLVPGRDVWLNDAGMVAFAAATGAFDPKLQAAPKSCCLWWKQTGTILATRLATGATGPGGNMLGPIQAIALHPTRARVTVEARLRDATGPPALYLCTVGEVSGAPALSAADYLGQLKGKWQNAAVMDAAYQLVFTVYDYAKTPSKRQGLFGFDLSSLPAVPLEDEDRMLEAQPNLLGNGYLDNANDEGTLSPAASVVGWDGLLHPVVIAGTETGSGRIADLGGTDPGYGIAINSQGQVALTAVLRDSHGASTSAILLLTPPSPSP